MNKKLFSLLIAAPFLASAATVTWVGGNSGRLENDSSWDTAGAGIGDYNTLGDLSAHTFVINQAQSWHQAQIRGNGQTPDSEGGTFNAATLNMQNGYLATWIAVDEGASGTYNYTFGDVNFNGGGLYVRAQGNGSNDIDEYMNGNFYFNATTTPVFIHNTQNNFDEAKKFTLGGNVGGGIHGTGNISVDVGNFSYGLGVLNLGGADSTWSGSLYTSFQETGDNLIIDFGYEANGSVLSLATGAVVRLDETLDFKYLEINGTGLSGQQWTYQKLADAGYGAYFIDGGGSINVAAVPEPSTFGLLSIGAVMLRRRFRRKN